jgi:GMP synthase-like glutamine amidotransferase
MAPRIGIVVCDHFPADTKAVAGGDVGDLHRRLLGGVEPGLELEEYDATSGALPAPDTCDAWVITGSRADAHGRSPWVLDLLEWIRHAADRARMAGICFGHQAVAQALGGQVERAAGGWTVGPQVLELDGTPWFEPATVTINAMHRDEVTRLPPGVSSLGHGTTAAAPAFIVHDRILCIQDHPEFEPTLTSHLINRRRDRIDPALAEAGLARCQTVPTDGHLVGRWMVDFLLDRRHAGTARWANRKSAD